MSQLFAPASPAVARATYLLDFVVCKCIHNPLLSSAVLVAILGYLAVRMLTLYLPLYMFGESDVLLDVLHHVVNAVFILRFPLTSKTTLAIRSRLSAELALFMCLNVSTVTSLYLPSPFPESMSAVLRVLLWSLVFCPYAIMAFNLLEYAVRKIHAKCSGQPEKQLLERAPHDSFLSILVDANNGILAILIAQSFTLINCKLYFYGSYWLSLAYRLASYSLKFHLVYCFVLHEILVVMFEITDIKAYAELYTPLSLTKPKNSWFRSVSYQQVLLTATALAMAYDVVLMACLYYQG